MSVDLQQQEAKDQDSNQSKTSHRTYTRTLVQTPEQFDDLQAGIEASPIVVYDVETNGKFSRFDVQLVGISFAAINDTVDAAWYLPFNHFDGVQLAFDYFDRLRPALTDPEKEYIAHNAKFDEMVLGVYDCHVKGHCHDTMVMAWLLNEQRARSGSRKLKALVEEHLGIKMLEYEEVAGHDDKNFARVPLELALDYAADDAYQTFKLWQFFKEKLEEENLWPAYYNVEGPFTRVSGNMEQEGVHIDQEALDYADKRLPEIFDEVEATIYEQAGEVFNIGSPPQLGRVLFEKLQIGKNVPKSKKSGNYKTDKKTLETYASHDIVTAVLRRKKIKKTHSTFVKGTRKAIRRDGKVHPIFNGCGTVTGRLSCSAPNLQQVEGDEVEEIKIRDFFVPAEGYKFVVADYEQVEYRLMAHFSGDEKMTEAFLSGFDYHAETARNMYDLSPTDEVTHRQRFIAKSVNFGIGYGRGAVSLAEVLQCSVPEAENYIDEYYRTFSGLARFKAHMLKQARQRGYIRTLSGRKRRLLPEIRSGQTWIRAHAERQAFNTKIQGSAADLIKMAMISLVPALAEHQAKMVIQIHDELVIECPADQALETLQTARHIMENPLKGKNPIRIPLKVDPKVVDRWGDAK